MKSDGSTALIPPQSATNVTGADSLRIADPKFFYLGEDVWLTFNSGWHQRSNQLFIQELHGTRTIECLLEPRQTVEKNWVFFRDGDRLRALYSLDPLRTVSASIEDLLNARETGMLSFRWDDDTKSIEPLRGGLSLGTQAVVDGSTLHLIAHEKRHVGKWRLYFGRAVKVNVSGDMSISVNSSRLSHSPLALLGTRPRLNKNLLSCTYFSGIRFEDNQVILSYGINDRSWGVARLPYEKLFNQPLRS